MNLISTGLYYYVELDNGDTVKISYSAYTGIKELDEPMTDCPFCDKQVERRILDVFSWMGEEDAKGFHDHLVH